GRDAGRRGGPGARGDAAGAVRDDAERVGRREGRVVAQRRAVQADRHVAPVEGRREGGEREGAVGGGRALVRREGHRGGRRRVVADTHPEVDDGRQGD